MDADDMPVMMAYQCLRLVGHVSVELVFFCLFFFPLISCVCVCVALGSIVCQLGSVMVSVFRAVCYAVCKGVCLTAWIE